MSVVIDVGSFFHLIYPNPITYSLRSFCLRQEQGKKLSRDFGFYGFEVEQNGFTLTIIPNLNKIILFFNDISFYLLYLVLGYRVILVKYLFQDRVDKSYSARVLVNCKFTSMKYCVDGRIISKRYEIIKIAKFGVLFLFDIIVCFSLKTIELSFCVIQTVDS